MVRRKLGLVAGILFVAFALTPVVAVAGLLEDGLDDAYNSGDYATLLQLLWPLAEQEKANVTAQFYLGLMYENGQGVPQDYAEALKWYRLAAEQGHAKAQNNIGVMYARGKGVPQDYVQAHMWSNLAASRMLPGEDHDKAVEQRDAVAERMAPAQIAEAQKLARDWRPVGEQAD